MRISELKRKALQSLGGKWGVTVSLMLLLFLINLIFPLIVEVIGSGGFSEWLMQEDTPLWSDIFSMVFSIALIPLTISTTWFYLNLVREGNPGIPEVFAIYKDGKTSFKLIGASILQAIFIFLWSLLLIIPGIIKAIAYSQQFFLLKDHPEYTVLEAITESKKRMKGLKWKYFLMHLSFIGWGILCMFTLGIGLLWLIPYAGTTTAAFYEELIVPQEDIDDDQQIEG
ncbi:DUF975 family protein [Peribacillus castrilensis]|jgi:uncharacterized membrane protein|uniref:Integral membrane protein n=3 Tax=Peribacillus TaxID=2675229 RepID=A0AAN2PLQ9_9BACI|nr:MULTISPECIES: DUF975 family protein [Bacillaceae]MBD8134540.1 DUF975 family protein [Bacillus sp. CFBP 13597]MCP1095258.1 DUF975 family protein [Bacillaceae bacterium OS4b]MBD8587635.1 DUF975 family protein [Peribacillus simplex]MCF7624065.1 DUF975 family protein [Peribacillus frigoritolerans]MCK2017272.1 DUF975 family protein [Peribacillus frigoritolerans]